MLPINWKKLRLSLEDISSNYMKQTNLINFRTSSKSSIFSLSLNWTITKEYSWREKSIGKSLNLLCFSLGPTKLLSLTIFLPSSIKNIGALSNTISSTLSWLSFSHVRSSNPLITPSLLNPNYH